MFEVITKPREYTLVDQMKEPYWSEEEYREGLNELLEKWREGDTPYLSLLMDTAFAEELTGRGFQVVSTIVEHEKSLGKDLLPTGQSWQTLEASGKSDQEFAAIYEACKSGSANKNQLFTMDQIMESMRLELGENWRELAMLFEERGEVIGLAIPHLEPNTISEGRLFYFGMMPEYRRKGKATACHLAALHKLKRLGATHYVGSTDTANTGMIRIMNANGAVERNRKGIYRINRN